jgi:hypothetical protein
LDSVTRECKRNFESGVEDSVLMNLGSTPGRDSRKNGAFSGVFGGSIGLFLSYIISLKIYFNRIQK